MLGLFVSPAFGTGGWAILLGVGAGGGPAAAAAALLALEDAPAPGAEAEAAAGADGADECDVVLKGTDTSVCIAAGISAAGTCTVDEGAKEGCCGNRTTHLAVVITQRIRGARRSLKGIMASDEGDEA